MRLHVLLLLLPALLPGCSGHQDADKAASAATPPAAPVISAHQAGPVRFGWTVRQLNATLHDSLAPAYDPGGDCAYVDPASFPDGVELMVVADTVERVDVDVPGVLTVDGAGLGNTEEQIRNLYGDAVRQTPHKYGGPEWHYLTVLAPDDTTFALVFETDGAVVTRYRAGRRPAVEYVEGCS